ncbi:lipopolysaccharide biosynthesis protein [Streptomyces sp. SB3404]|uniref:Lipopolysaccharide biosynthesis protein n=2 Tax=Streptomyces boncukensis TaxID=2711219 RepID=A0A6G4X6C4_9ACTN|nr:polysaccharide biosynthesis C-terminal domain-containing protein [Streptomyces boncukensis]NGO72410.1 lipopolysaccharide biosynthesis protein [Streptomyces boncukensis]
MLNTGISAVLGLGYWVVAARYYTDDAVGQGSAAIAAMKFLAGLTAVTLMGALARFIPVAGRTTGRLIFRTYAASSAVVACAAVVFLLTLDWWGPSYRFLHGALPGAGFVLVVVAWSLLTLQDGVLTGLRSAKWVPVGNTVFSTVKLVLLVVLAAAVPTSGVFVSWGLAIGLSTIPLGWLVFRRLVPRHMAATQETARPAGYREMGRFLAGDYTGALFSLAVVYLVPVIVAAQVSSADNAYFYITATIGGTVNLLAINMGASLTVEGSHTPERLADNCRAALRRMTRIMLPVCGGLFLLAPQILGVFGDGYAEAATPLLRLYAVGAVLRVVIETYYAVLRAQSRTSGLAYLQGLLCVLVLGLTVALLPSLGLTGAGIAEAGSLTVVAVIAGWKLRGVLRSSPPGRGDGTGHQVPPDGDLSDLAAHGDQSAPGWAHACAADAPTLQLRADIEHLERHPSPARHERPEGARGAARPATADPQPAANSGPRHLTGAVGLWALLALATALYWLPLARVGEAELADMGGLGLVSVLPPGTLLGAAGLVAVFAGALWTRRQHRALLTAALLVTVVSLHAVPAVLEGPPRFATAWEHLGFLDHLARTGTAAPELDARWSWPGFFAGAAFLVQACGVDDLTGLIRWWPTLIQLAYLAPLALLLRAVRAGWRAKWCAAWFFALAGWVGQDYFSPQGFTFLFYLLFVALLLVWFREPRVLRGGREPGESDPPDGAPRGERGVLLGVLLALFLASVAGHQLTPFVMLGVLTGLILVRRCVLHGLPLLCGVLLAVWIGYLAEPYWSGHFDELFGGVGGVGGNVSSSVSGRIEGGSETHKLVLYARVGLAGGTLALAAFGLLRRLRGGISDRALVVLTALPFLAFGAQSYGGEIALRVFLFAAPGACVLAALGLFPRPHARRPHWLAGAATLLIGLTLMGGFLVARWGNEPFERVREGEVAAMEYVYAHDRPSARVLWPSSDPVNNVTPAMPWGARDMARVAYVPTRAPLSAREAPALVEALREAGPHSYLMLNEGQSTSLHFDAGYPEDWRQRMIAALDVRPELRKVVANEDAAVYELRVRSRAAADPPDPGPAGPRVTWTSWSVTGGLAALVLLVLLTAREAVRVVGRPGERKLTWLQSTFWFSLPLVLLLAASLVQRFVTMS